MKLPTLLVFPLLILLLSGCSSVMVERQAGYKNNFGLPPVFGVEWERSDLDVYPGLKMGQPPPYPIGMKSVGGYATIQFTVNEKGRVEEAQVLDMSHPYFGGNAEWVTQYWHFHPAEKDGEAIPATGVIRWQFAPMSRWVKTSVQEELREAEERKRRGV